ncbi:MAG: hypothetical protein HFH38_09085 [Lachnospiraceae bacterium]|nr:hypothetical protein [Lachnospiraceae bacterium]
MKKIVIAVCDADQAYGERLAAWLSQENKERFFGCCFQEAGSFLEYRKVRRPDIVLLGEGFLGSPEVWEQVQGEAGGGLEGQQGTLWIRLYGQGEEGDLPGYKGSLPTLDKYQPVSQMVRDILSLYQACGVKGEMAPFRQELIGIYSPGHSIWQTPFALALAQVLGQQERVLYVSLKECAGFSQWFQEEYQKDLLDVMYLCLTGAGAVLDCIGSAAYQMEGFSYIPPAGDSVCLSEVQRQDYLRFVKILAEQSGYDVVILDFGMMVPGFFELLGECSKAYILTEAGELQEGPLHDFAQMAKRQGLPMLADKISYLTLPDMQPMPCQRGQWLQQWMWGSLGDCARRLMGVQGGTD